MDARLQALLTSLDEGRLGHAREASPSLRDPALDLLFDAAGALAGVRSEGARDLTARLGALDRDHAAFAHASAKIALLAWLESDGAVTRRLASVPPSSDPHAHTASVFVRALDSLTTGALAPSDDELRDAQAQAVSVGEAARAIDLASARALLALARFDHETALSLARRASRMAQTERFPQSQYLANSTLARARRTVGRAHLATRIVRAIARVAPSCWRPWLEWELALAGDSRCAEIDRALAAAAAGDRGALATSVGEFPRAHALSGDLGTLVAILDPLSLSHDPSVLAWREGLVHAIPRGLDALSAGADPHASLAAVVSRPNHMPVRIATAGIGLVEGPHVVLHQLLDTRRSGPLVAAVALAGETGLTDAALFETVYGFAYDEALHRGRLDVQLHRTRGALGEHAELVRRGATVTLRPRTTLVIPDPRCARPTEAGLLRMLARSDAGVAARDLAAELGLPLRTVQAALEGLVEEGACVRVRNWRQVAYKVEDTTFEEPTRH